MDDCVDCGEEQIVVCDGERVDVAMEELAEGEKGALRVPDVDAARGGGGEDVVRGCAQGGDGLGEGEGLVRVRGGVQGEEG